jgi:hypothetical protein
VVGGFTGDRGEDEHDGRPVKVRFIWNRRGRDAARWEQVFAFDGRPWETNWIMGNRPAGMQHSSWGSRTRCLSALSGAQHVRRESGHPTRRHRSKTNLGGGSIS